MFKPVILFVLLTAGCATAADIHSSGIDETAFIAKPIEQVSECMTLRMGTAPVAVDGKSTFFVKDAYDSTLALISLSEVNDGTQVEIRRRDSLVSTGMWKGCR